MPKHNSKRATLRTSGVLTVQHILDLAAEAQSKIAAGQMHVTDPVHVSLEVMRDGDESTYGNRVHGGEAIQVSAVENFGGGSYLHIQLIGEPNFKVYQ